MKAGSGNDTLVAGTGNDTMTGGSGHDLFVFFNNNAGGQNVINDMTGNDTVAFAGYNLQSLSASLQNATTSGGSVSILLSDNTRITFNGITSLTNQHII